MIYFSLPIGHKSVAQFSFRFFSLLQLDMEYNKFIRTTNPKHEAVVDDFYSKLLSSSNI